MVDGNLEGRFENVGCMDGLEEDVAEGTGDGQVVPIGIDISSDVKFLPSWIRVEPKCIV